MQVDQLAEIANRFVSNIPVEVTNELRDVDLLICENPEHARKEIADEIIDPDPDQSIAEDCKGMFVGDPMEVEESEESEENEIVVLPEGVIVLVASNISTPEEAGLVLMHEMGHALGLDEEEVKQLGLGVEGKANVSKDPATSDNPTV